MIVFYQRACLILLFLKVCCIPGVNTQDDRGFPISFLDCRESSVLAQVPISQTKLILYSSDPEVRLNIPNDALRYDLSGFPNHMSFFQAYSGVIRYDSINGTELGHRDLQRQFQQLYTTRNFTKTSDHLPACGGCIYHALIDDGSQAAPYQCPSDIDITVDDDCVIAQYHVDWIEPYIISNGKFVSRTDITKTGEEPGYGFVPGTYEIKYSAICSFTIRVRASCKTIFNVTTPAGLMNFNSTEVGYSSAANTRRCPHFWGAENLTRANAKCYYTNEQGPFWEPPNLTDCLMGLSPDARFAKINAELDILLQSSTPVPRDHVVEVGLAIREVSKLSSEDDIVEKVGKLLDKFINLNDSSDEVTNIVLSVANNVFEENDEREDESEREDLNRIVISLERQALNQITSGNNFTGIETNVALLNRVVNGSATNLSLSFANFKVNEGDSDGVVIDNLDRQNITVISGQISGADNNILASVSLPNNTRMYVKEGSPLAVSFLLYKNGALFSNPSQPVGQLASSIRQEVGSQVVATTVHNLSDNSIIFSESDPLVTTFAPIQVARAGEKKLKDICVFWDFSNGGFWSTKGCSLDTVQQLSSRVVCRCNHATSFAVLVNIEEQHLIYSWISQLGCALSAFALLFTIISILSIRKLRAKTPYKVHVSLMISLMALYVTFLFGVDSTEPMEQCISISAALHYFLLASFFWMLMEGILIYKNIVVAKATVSPRHFMLYSSLISWGMPIIPVAAPLVMASFSEQFEMKDFYQLDEYCFLKPDSLIMYIGLIGIMAVILAFNLIIMILVFIRLCRPEELIEQDRRKFVGTFVIITVIFGLTWGVGFFAIRDATFYVSIAFSVLNSFQGFFIFLLLGVRQAEVRKLWTSPFFGMLGRRVTSSTKSSSK